MTEYNENTKDSARALAMTITIARIFLRNFKKIAAVTAVLIIITAVYVFVLPNEYTSTASILPSGRSDNLSALKQLAGLTGGGVDIDENSSALFPEILRSNQVRDAVAEQEYSFKYDGETETYSFRDDFPGATKEELRDAVGAITEITGNTQTGIITIDVTTEYPELSQQILQRTLDELERYNSEIRRSQAKESARYLERELKAREKDLAASEEKLAEFQKANQNWYSTTDPDILTELSRHERDIQINSQAYLLLREQYELARLSVQKDIPVVSLLDPPTLPALKSGPRRKLIIAAVGVIAFLLTFMFILLREAYRAKVSSADAKSIGELRTEVVRNIPVVNRLLLKRQQEKEKSHTADQ